MSKETREEFHQRLHYGQVDFDQLADWYYDLDQQNAIIRESLGWYADSSHYMLTDYGMGNWLRPADVDGGKKAREALAKVDKV